MFAPPWRPFSRGFEVDHLGRCASRSGDDAAAEAVSPDDGGAETYREPCMGSADIVRWHCHCGTPCFSPNPFVRPEAHPSVPARMRSLLPRADAVNAATWRPKGLALTAASTAARSHGPGREDLYPHGHDCEHSYNGLDGGEDGVKLPAVGDAFVPASTILGYPRSGYFGPGHPCPLWAQSRTEEEP
jgi:hypothetical protein